MVKACQPAYLAAKRRDKPRIAAGIVLAVRKVGGRFLKKDSQNTWKDVGNNRAREKTSQALREGAPELRSSTAAARLASITATASSPAVSRAPVLLMPKHSVMMPFVAPAAAAAAMPEESRRNLVPHDSLRPAKKAKRRSSLDQLAEAAALRPAPYNNHGFGSWPPQGAAAPSSSGASFVANISGDDDDSSASDEPKKTEKRGPRIKLLKQRLEAS